MFRFKSENLSHLNAHNIRLSEFNSTASPEMSQPRKVIHLPKVRMLRGGAPPGAPSGVRITNVKSIKPPDPEALKRQEEEKLRAQLQKEIVSRSRHCANKTYECTLPVVSGRQYCGRHILQDPTAPYKQCGHMAGGERCPLPAPAGDARDQGLCFTHARATLAARQRSAAQPPPVTTTETLLNQLQHYVKPERPRTTSCASSVSVVSDQGDQDQGVPSAIDPFKQIDATAVNTQYSASIMECASASDSDCDSVTLGPEGSCRFPDDDPLAPSEDAPCENQPLWRAGVYTAEEAVSEARSLLRSLQAAYARQLRRLRALLRAERARYLAARARERDRYCSINSQARNGPLTVRERRLLRKLKAYASHHRKHGVDALLARKLLQKRTKQGLEPGRGVPAAGRCTFAEGGVRCAAAALPAARHCLRHVLHDRHQVLFAACGDVRGCTSCREPIARLPLPAAACRYHTDPPAYTPFTLKKYESDSDSDSTGSSGSSRPREPSQPPRDETEAPAAVSH